jgi:uncharacterized protein
MAKCGVPLGVSWRSIIIAGEEKTTSMTTLIVDLLAQTQERAATATLVDVCIGVHWTLVTLEIAGAIRAGLASTLSGSGEGHTHGTRAPISDAGQLLAWPIPELAALVQSDSLLEASVGMATVNALLEVDMSLCREINAADIIAERGAGQKVAVVGHFPFVSQLRAVADTLWVLELTPGPDDLPAARASELLPQADVVALTGTSLLNKTFDELIALCRDDAFVVVLGATTPLSPLFFRYGVNAVSGTIIEDWRKGRVAVSQGATFRQLPGRRMLTLMQP